MQMEQYNYLLPDLYETVVDNVIKSTTIYNNSWDSKNEHNSAHQIQGLFNMLLVNKRFYNRLLHKEHEEKWSEIYDSLYCSIRGTKSLSFKRSFIYCTITPILLKKAMLSFIEEKRILYRSQKTNAILPIYESMKKIKTLPRKIKSARDRDHLKGLIKKYDYLHGNQRKMRFELHSK